MVNNAALGDGGAIYNRAHSSDPGHVTLINSTLSGNRASGRGGAVYNGTVTAGTSSGVFQSNNSTISNNLAGGDGGIFIDGVATLHNTIVPGNVTTKSGQDSPSDIVGSVIAHSSLVGDTSGLTFSQNSSDNLWDVAPLF